MLSLDVHLEGVDGPVGRLARADTGAMSFRYRNGDLPLPISQSLPLSDEPFDDVATRGFFENLLFENAQREQVMQRHGIEHTDVVGLLFYLGRDCPGAISVVPEDAPPGKKPGLLGQDYFPLSEAGLHEIMLSLRDHRRMPPESDDPSPLAGVQGKVALTVLQDGRFALPRAGSGAPTTHILKVPRRREMRLVEHEHILMELAADVLHHPVAATKIMGDEHLRGLLIRRYDRAIDNGCVRRIHQEDFCQALGLGPSLKYQRDGVAPRIFSANRVGALLGVCDVPAQARAAFLEGTILNLLLGNTDNHAKNHSLLYAGPRPDRPQLAPFYDIVPTLIDDQVTHQLAFDIGSAIMTDEIAPEDLHQFARDLCYKRLAAPMRHRLAELTEAVTARIPEMNGPARKRLGDAFAEQARWIASALELELEIPERDLVPINRP